MAERDGPKRGHSPLSRTADVPAQTLNIDLCFVPATHVPHAALPAVSGSSGRLLVSRTKDEAVEPSYPGRVFADPDLDYAEAMAACVAASAARDTQGKPSEVTDGADAGKTHRQALRQDEEALRLQRRQGREQRRLEDAAWQTMRTAHRSEQATPSGQSRTERAAAAAQWDELRRQRQASLTRRATDDAAWRAQRQALRERAAHLPHVTAWLAILVILDNCTRQCLGLPLFVAGAHVTAEGIVEALRAVLPSELHYLISDRGTHFTAQVFKQLAQAADFVHVVTARHRPQSNGIAERFVLTLKQWLAQYAWQSSEELEALLARLRPEYNDRPHQGLPIPGLSPNAFADRLWLL